MSSAFPVKWFDSTFRGAPVLSGTAGAFISLLDACLIDGFGAITPTKIEVDGNIATVTVNAGETFTAYAVISVSGATPAQLNGEARVLTSSATSFTFATDAADGLATGTISVRYAPVGGWQKTFSGVNKAAYRSIEPLASGFYLRVDDTGTTIARVVGYEAMTDIDTGTNPFPTDAQISGGGYLAKSDAADVTARPWCLFADARFVHWGTCPKTGGYNTAALRGFGDLQPVSTTDAYAVAISTNTAFTQGDAKINGAFVGSADAIDATGTYVARALSGAVGSQLRATRPYTGASTSVGGFDTTLGTAPSPIDGKLRLARRYLNDLGDRAVIPGLLHMPMSAQSLPHMQLLSDQLDERRLYSVVYHHSSVFNTGAQGRALFDITGPWR